MSPRSSLFKWAIAPLLAVAAATAFSAPTQAATAAFNPPCQVVNQGSSYVGISERVDCNFIGDALWQEADFHTTLLGGDGTNNYDADLTNLGMACGGGDYFVSALCVLGHAPHGTYDCWCVCKGTDTNNVAWNASTGGTDFVTY